MPETVYNAPDTDGKPRPVADAVYNGSTENCADTRNHNPRVGGSSPSSATIGTAEICDSQHHMPSADQAGLQPRVNRLGQVIPEWGRPLAEVIDWLTYELTPEQFAIIRRNNPGHTFAKFTYFARCLTTGNIKIGRSREPNERMKQLQAATGNPHELLATLRGGENESAYHSIFTEHRLYGEWFAPAPEILAEIDRLSLPTGR